MSKDDRPGPLPGAGAASRRGRLYHSPLFWIGASMFLAAMALYLWSEDLSRLPWN